MALGLGKPVGGRVCETAIRGPCGLGLAGDLHDTGAVSACCSDGKP